MTALSLYQWKQFQRSLCTNENNYSALSVPVKTTTTPSLCTAPLPLLFTGFLANLEKRSVSAACSLGSPLSALCPALSPGQGRPATARDGGGVGRGGGGRLHCSVCCTGPVGKTLHWRVTVGGRFGYKDTYLPVTFRCAQELVRFRHDLPRVSGCRSV